MKHEKEIKILCVLHRLYETNFTCLGNIHVLLILKQYYSHKTYYLHKYKMLLNFIYTEEGSTIKSKCIIKNSNEAMNFSYRGTCSVHSYNLKKNIILFRKKIK